MNRPNPLKPEVDNILSEIGDLEHSKPILDTMRPTIPDKQPTQETKPSQQESKPDNSSNTTPSNSDSKPTPSPSPISNPDNSSYFSHYLTPEDKKKLARYERLHFERIPENWEDEVQRLKDNKKPDDLPSTWREELRTIEDLRKRPTWEALHKAVSEEKENIRIMKLLKEL